MLAIHNETAPLKQVVIGLGVPFQRDKERVAAEMGQFPLTPNTKWKEQVLALTYPTENQLVQEYKDYVAALEKHSIEVLFPDPEAAYSFDYTCPRDIGFVIGDRFFVSRMSVQSRAEEIKTIESVLGRVSDDKIVWAPENTIIEGGDVIVLDEHTVLCGIHQRTNLAGFKFLKGYLDQHGITVLPVPHKQLHLDCCLNPLGKGHMLIHPDSLIGLSGETWAVLKRFEWIEVNDEEREHLATNVLSLSPDTIIARKGEIFGRVNGILKEFGYTLEEITFDGVSATGGSFRCASLPLLRT